MAKKVEKRKYAKRPLMRGFEGSGMAGKNTATTGIAFHGASRLLSVAIDSFNIELKDKVGFLGDRASKGAFRKALEVWRKPLRKSGDDPFGKEHSEDISKKELDATLMGDDSEASVPVHKPSRISRRDLPT